MAKTNEYIGVAEAAEILGINPKTVRRRIIRGDFSFIVRPRGARAPYILSRHEVLALAVTK